MHVPIMLSLGLEHFEQQHCGKRQEEHGLDKRTKRVGEVGDRQRWIGNKEDFNDSSCRPSLGSELSSCPKTRELYRDRHGCELNNS